MSFEIDKNLTLRLLQAEDAVNLFTLVDTNRSYLKEWLSWLDHNTDVKDTVSFIASIQDQFRSGLGYSCGVFFNSGLVGMCGYHPINISNKSVVIGYWLSENAQGSGIITRCTKFFIEHAFCEFMLNEVHISVAVNNLKSCAVCDRLGLISNGIVSEAEFLYDKYVDHIKYSISREEWLARQKSGS